MKKIFLMVLIALGCSEELPTPPPAAPDHEEPKDLVQYGVPFAAVADPKNVVMYEINIRAFSEQGNFQGVIDRLDEIKALGVNTIWLMPIHPVGKERSAGGLGSPYAVQNYLEVNPEFGNLDKLRELVQEAHDRNIAVIIDWVANHTAWDNPWINDHKSWYTQDENGNIIIPPGTNWQDVAELNYDNSEMRKAMIYAMKYWVLQANIDGFRCDAVDFVPSDFWKQALDELKAIEGRKLILLAEGGKQDNFTAGFQMNYAWDFYNNLKKVYNNNQSASSIFTTHLAEYNSIPEGTMKLRYTTNHDESAWEATPMEIFHGKSGALSASVITLFTSAVPLLYSSQEVGQEELLPFFERDPIEWSENEDMKNSYEKLLGIYNETEAFRNGTLEYFNDQDIAIFTKTSGSEKYLVAVNVRNTQQEVTLNASIQNTTWINRIDESSVNLTSTLSLPAFGYVVLKKQ